MRLQPVDVEDVGEAVAKVMQQTRKGVLPRPQMIGDLKRWDFTLVRAAIESQNGVRKRMAPNGQPGPDEDPFLAALTPER
jgi:hypothetical protein